MGLNTYVDISSNNGTPNLAAYRAAGHTDLMLKATEGSGYAWLGMDALAREWHSFGPQYRVGYYHWLYGTISASVQYGWFWQHVAPVWRAGDWMMTDFEDVDPSRHVPDAQHLAVVREFDRLCGQHGPVHDYAPNWYVESMPQCIAYFRTRPVVTSDYSNSPSLNPHGFTFVAHQFTDRAVIAGMNGGVDYNRWLGEVGLGSGTPLEEEDMTPQQAADLTWLKQKTAEQDADLTWIKQKLVQVADAIRLQPDHFDDALSRAGVGPAPRSVWLADARNAAVNAQNLAAQTLAVVKELEAKVTAVTPGGAGPSVDAAAIAAAVVALEAKKLGAA